jgi:peroxiredoxin
MSPPATNLEAGQALPELTLHTLSGNDVSLAKFHGVKTAFSIVSPHCSPCHSLLEAIAKGDEAMDKLDPTVQRRVIVSLGNVTETADLVRETRLHQGLPVLVDTENEVAKRWGVTSTPVTVIVDDKLTVVRQFVGAGSGTA